MDDAIPVKAWRDRATAVPQFPGGGDLQIIRLSEFLRHVSGEQSAGWIEDAGYLQQRLGSLGLTAKVGGRVELTEQGRSWLVSQSTTDLYRILAGSHAYFAEVLQALANADSRVEDLLDDAAGAYRLGWTSADQIRRRLIWLHAMGLVEDGPNRLHRLTEAGREALKLVPVVLPADLVLEIGEDDVVLPPPAPLLAAELETIAFRPRAESIGFLPRDPLAALKTLITLAEGGVVRGDLIADLAAGLALSPSSARTFIDVARVLGLHEYTGREAIAVTDLGREFVETADPLALVRLMHSRYIPFGEILTALNDSPAKAAEVHRRLTGVSATAAQLNRMNTVLRRLAEADAVAEVGYARFVITPVGVELAKSLPLELAKVVQSSGPVQIADEFAEVDLRLELQEASVDAGHPTRFERAVAETFKQLDVEARHIGGPGETDVLVTIRSALQPIAQFIVDGKTAASGNLREDSVIIETLREHSAKHDNARIIVVAPGYEGSGRLPDRAAAAGIRLLTAVELADLLDEHLVRPFRPEDLAGVLLPETAVETRDRRQRENRMTEVLKGTLQELARESHREDAEPITARDIYRSMRETGDISEAQISAILGQLAEPWVGAVTEVSPGKYALSAPPRVAARRLRATAKLIEDIGALEEANQ